MVLLRSLKIKRALSELKISYAVIPINTLISVDIEKLKSVPFLRFFLYISRRVSMPLIVEEAVRRLLTACIL